MNKQISMYIHADINNIYYKITKTILETSI